MFKEKEKEIIGKVINTTWENNENRVKKVVNNRQIVYLVLDIVYYT
jgi:hypothetical protein